jgi:hypothetical protein
MERRMRRKSHVRCGAGENLEIVSKDYLSLSDDLVLKGKKASNTNSTNESKSMPSKDK